MRNTNIQFTVPDGMVDNKMANRLIAWGMAVRLPDEIEDAVAHEENKRFASKKKVAKKLDTK